MMDALLLYVSLGIVICTWLVPKDYIEFLSGLAYLALIVIAWPITIYVAHRDFKFRKLRERIEPTDPEFGDRERNF